jgi:hypothetical protein
MFPVLNNFRAKASVFLKKRAAIVPKYHAEIASLLQIKHNHEH